MMSWGQKRRDPLWTLGVTDEDVNDWNTMSIMPPKFLSEKTNRMSSFRFGWPFYSTPMWIVEKCLNLPGGPLVTTLATFNGHCCCHRAGIGRQNSKSCQAIYQTGVTFAGCWPSAQEFRIGSLAGILGLSVALIDHCELSSRALAVSKGPFLLDRSIDHTTLKSTDGGRRRGINLSKGKFLGLNPNKGSSFDTVQWHTKDLLTMTLFVHIVWQRLGSIFSGLHFSFGDC